MVSLSTPWSVSIISLSVFLPRSLRQRGIEVLHTNVNWQRCSVWEEVSIEFIFTFSLYMKSIYVSSIWWPVYGDIHPVSAGM